MNQSKEVKKLQNQIQDLKGEKEKLLEEKMKQIEDVEMRNKKIK